MKEQTNISVILPIYKLDDTTKALFNNAVESVSNQLILPEELVIVVDKNDAESLSYVKSYDYKDISSIVTIIENEGKTDFPSQVNLGVNKAKGEWVSILEQDDEYSKIYFKNVVKYRNANPNVELFMPIIVDVDPNFNFLNFTNEACWANGFSEELGFLDNNSLLAYQNFSVDGIVIKKSVYTDLGGLKSNIKLTFPYEFLLRMTFKAVRTMIVPKFGYKHMNQREGSLFKHYKDTMNSVESRWWLATAKKEYYHTKDREITYASQNV